MMLSGIIVLAAEYSQAIGMMASLGTGPLKVTGLSFCPEVKSIQVSSRRVFFMVKGHISGLGAQSMLANLRMGTGTGLVLAIPQMV
jgi:hypothetical protein